MKNPTIIAQTTVVAVKRLDISDCIKFAGIKKRRTIRTTKTRA